MRLKKTGILLVSLLWSLPTLADAVLDRTEGVAVVGAVQNTKRT